MDGLYESYWQFLETRRRFGALKRPVLKWYPSRELNELQRAYFEFVSDAKRILDFGAGDLDLKRKFERAGFTGEYRTCDLSPEFQHDFASLDEVAASGTKFDAILALEVIEHIPLSGFPDFLRKLLSCLAPGGRLVLSTPNAGSINAVWATDITHVHSYPLPDLWALLTLQGFDCAPYRVVLMDSRASLKKRAELQVARVLTHFLGVDYATGVALLCRRSDLAFK